jgi:hypothetical protein
MGATGHEPIYGWRCVGAKAMITATLFQVDQRGFIARFWTPPEPRQCPYPN